MRRRRLLTGMGVAGAAGAVLGLDAFSRASADRDATIDVVGDRNGYLALRPESEYATTTDSGALALQFTERQGQDGGTGVATQSRYEFDGVFRVANNGTETVEVTAGIEGDGTGAIEEFSLYVAENTANTLEGSTEGSYNVIDPGQEFLVGVAIETGSERTQEEVIDIRLTAGEPDGSGGQSGGDGDDEGGDTQRELPPLVMDSVASLLDANGETLTDESIVSVWAEDAARNVDSDGNGDSTPYDDGTPIPVVATDGSNNTVGFGAMFVEDPSGDSGYTKWDYGSEEFVLNVWDATFGDATDGTATVLWDEGHGQFYELAKFSAFEGYAESHGYDVRATSDIGSDLPDADAAVITSPSNAFDSSEKQALNDFVGDGGQLFLHDQADFNDFDETGNLNDLASSLGLAFRFNDDQVEDEFNNDGEVFKPITDEFNDASFDYFGDRFDTGLGLDPYKTYETTVEEVTDGDTVDVELNGRTESIRVLGIDTPETSSNSQFERVQEWEGIEDGNYLGDAGDAASDYASGELSGENVEVFFDDSEPVRDVFDRVLGYIRYDASGDGSRDTLYNRRVIEDGHARVYDSTLTRHDEFLDAEDQARAAGREVWSASDPENSPEFRDRDVSELVLPVGSSVRTTAGAVADSQVPVYAEPTAEQNGDDTYSGTTEEIPTVALDDSSGVALFGSPLIDESYEPDENSDGYDASAYENYVFLTNVIDSLADGDSPSGDVLIDGGHGQFAGDYALSAEDAAYYLRYLEGQDGIGFQGVNDLTDDDLDDARAVIVTAPAEPYTTAELDALAAFRDGGGAVVLMHSGDPLPRATGHLNGIAEALGTDLRLTADIVLDDTNNENADREVPTTTNFDESFDLFSAYS